MRIFIGLVEVANLTWNYAKGFRALGHGTFTVVTERNPFYPEAKYDWVINERSDHAHDQRNPWHKLGKRARESVLLLVAFIRASLTCDAFVFVGGSSFLPGKLDYPILRLLRKQIVVAFMGSDIRYWYAYEFDMRRLGFEERFRPFIEYSRKLPGNSYRQKTRIVRMAEKYADLILSNPGYAQLQRRPYHRANVCLDLSEFVFHVPARTSPVVVHAPSKRSVKGTELVLAAVRELESQGISFEFRLLENRPHPEVRQALADADIVVDELYADTVGVLSTEAMASGCVTLDSYLPEYSGIGVDCPVVPVDPMTLAGKLRDVILSLDLRVQLAGAGRKYVETHNGHIEVARGIITWLEGGAVPYDFAPTFFAGFSVPRAILNEERKERRRMRFRKLCLFLSCNAPS